MSKESENIYTVYLAICDLLGKGSEGAALVEKLLRHEAFDVNKSTPGGNTLFLAQLNRGPNGPHSE